MLKRLEREGMVVVPAQNDNGHAGAGSQHLGDRAQAMGVRERKIQQYHIEPASTELGKAIHQSRRMRDGEPIERPFAKDVLRELSIHRVVFNQKHFDHGESRGGK